MREDREGSSLAGELRAATDGARCSCRPVRTTCPRRRRPTEKFPLMKLPMRPATKPSGVSGAMKSIVVISAACAASNDRDGDEHADESAGSSCRPSGLEISSGSLKCSGLIEEKISEARRIAPRPKEHRRRRSVSRCQNSARATPSAMTHERGVHQPVPASPAGRGLRGLIELRVDGGKVCPSESCGCAALSQRTRHDTAY